MDKLLRSTGRLLGTTVWLLCFYSANLPAGELSDGPESVTLHGATMGTTYSIKYRPVPKQLQPHELQPLVDTLLEQINQQMSTYLSESELSRFNRAPADQWFEVSAETEYVVRKAIEFHRLTDGAFDVTVGPLVKLWNFGPQSDTSAVEPTEVQLRAALATVGCQHLQTRPDPPALRKTIDALQVDLSSIAKGYAVDAVGELLTQHSIDHWMVEIGGEVRAAGSRPDGSPWRIGVEHPQPDRRAVNRVVLLHDAALATSGDYRIFRRSAEGVAYSHLIDPATGQPLPYRGVAVSVLAETCLEADALATAVLVMGREQGYQWCLTHDVAALFLFSDVSETPATATPRFDQLTQPAATGNGSLGAMVLVSIAVFAVALIGMAIGVILSNRRLRGSCGALGGLRDAQGQTLCEACTNPSPTCTGESSGVPTLPD